MGQKINPHGLRVGVVRDLESQWYDEEYHENMDFVIKFNSYKLSKKICNFDYSAIKQFIRRVMQKIAKMLVLSRQRLLA